MKYVVIAVKYFSEAKALPKKSGVTVASFLYEFIYRHGCPRIQINNNDPEFVNKISIELHKLSETKQRLTAPCHPQYNNLVEWANRTTKEKFEKLLS